MGRSSYVSGMEPYTLWKGPLLFFLGAMKGLCKSLTSHTGRPLEQGHYQNLVLSSTDLGEHLVLGRFVLPVLIPMLIPGSILFTRPILVHTFYL